MNIYETDANVGGPQMRANLRLVKPSPTPVNGTVPPKRARNADVRPREYLAPKEVEKLIKASRARGRYGARDELAILMAYRHGLRASETGPFSLYIRAYWADKPVLDGQWKPPVVTRV